MAIRKYLAREGTFSPEDLRVLQQVFDQACVERQITKDSVEAEALAAELMMLFHSGIAGERELNAELSNSQVRRG
jgi:hypothetical protein